jgi:hypothetical protein
MSSGHLYLALPTALSNCSAYWRMSNQEVGHVLLINTCINVWKSQKQKLYWYFWIDQTKTMSNIYLKIDFVNHMV